MFSRSMGAAMYFTRRQLPALRRADRRCKARRVVLRDADRRLDSAAVDPDCRVCRQIKKGPRPFDQGPFQREGFCPRSTEPRHSIERFMKIRASPDTQAASEVLLSVRGGAEFLYCAAVTVTSKLNGADGALKSKMALTSLLGALSFPS